MLEILMGGYPADETQLCPAQIFSEMQTESCMDYILSMDPSTMLLAPLRSAKGAQYLAKHVFPIFIEWWA